MLTAARLRKAVLGLLVVSGLALSACGNDANTKRTKATLDEVSSLIKSAFGRNKGAAGPGDPNVMIANALREFEDASLMFVLREKTGAYGMASIYGQNDRVTTWVTRDIVSLSLDRPMLTATRGFGNDLMSVEDGGAAGLITARQAGQAQKTYRFLDGQDRTSRLILSCSIVPGETQAVESGVISTSTRVVRETCRRDAFNFTNTYWIDAQGRMVQSVQWAGAENGQLVLRRVRW
ncbi:YjbF family lipoprotein [Celeribacter sp. PS-C1]|uniref:YjbF family lipoprotein n=1 Tax=Celeribacter sp. PS-C1 TaxID=2820813 RepID=UPI001C679530|nr:YjbF family lipoprotein [Celeribacter sp. PS-C1]MBW6416463.1 YjbF family lipoprotein [Celeribacter sp. PS-C1]